MSVAKDSFHNDFSNEENIPGSEKDRAIIRAAYRQLLNSIKTTLEPADHKAIRQAFELAAEAHKTQRRKSGDPYILHPIEVANICVHEIGLGPTAVVCALLHDVVEDTDVTLAEVRAQFGTQVSMIVDGLTKLDSLHESESPQAENISKVLRAMVSDVRVVLIKMADRLHNLRTIKSMPPHKQLKIAAETSSIYTPLAHRLGLYKIKTEFQDACLKITHPIEYKDIAEKLSDTKRNRELYIEEFCEPIRTWMDSAGIKGKVIGRPKSIYSIWNKIRQKQVAFEDIFDLFAIRIILDVPPEEEKSACWQAYTFVTDHFMPIPERVKDWISLPKSNGYESLHTTVIGPEGRFVEVQIRSERMDDIAERGFAAHWKYKGIKSISKLKHDVFENWLSQVRDSLENSMAGNAVDFLNEIQGNFFTEEVHVFTPSGEMRILPKGATALDFAFSIHSDLGKTCQAVKVNNKLVPISHVLQSGDQVEVIRNKNQKPADGWLKFVITTKARNRIRAALKEEQVKQAEYGKEILQRKLNAFKVTVEDNLEMLVKYFKFPNHLEFLSAIAHEQVDLKELKKFRADSTKLVEVTDKQVRPEVDLIEVFTPVDRKGGSQKLDIIINDQPGRLFQYSMATCCNPMPGDTIFAYTNTSNITKIHRSTCPNAQNLLTAYSHRVMKASWGNTVQTNFVADIIVMGVDTGPGVINALTDRLAMLGLNIRSFSISGEDGFFEGRISLIVANLDQLNVAMRSLKELEWVSSVARLE